MNNKISIGQYIPTNSWLHRLDPRFKIASLVLLLVAAFTVPVSNNIVSIILILGLLILSIILNISAKVPIKKMIAGIKPLIFLLTFTLGLQLFMIDTGTPIFAEPLVMNISFSSVGAVILMLFFYQLTKKYIPFRTIYFFLAVIAFFYLQYLLPYGSIISYRFNPTDEGLIRGLFLFVRIMITVFLTSLLTFTTMTTDLNFGIEALLKPLKVIKVPVEVMAMMLALILRYIPTLFFETEKIMKAQASRGMDFQESKLREKITQVIALLVPIFLISITRAEELSDAMEARGYVIGAKRTRIDEYQIRFVDVLAIILTLIVLAAFIYLRTWYLK